MSTFQMNLLLGNLWGIAAVWSGGELLLVAGGLSYLVVAGIEHWYSTGVEQCKI